MKFGKFDMRYNPHNLDSFEDENGKQNSLLEEVEFYEYLEKGAKSYSISFEAGIGLAGEPFIDFDTLKCYTIDENYDYEEYKYEDIEDEVEAMEQFKKDYPNEVAEFENFLYEYYEDDFKEMQKEHAEEITNEIVEEVIEM